MTNKVPAGFLARLKTAGPFRAPNGVIFGVASGLAEHYGWSPGLVRLIFILTALFLFFWPMVLLYLIATLVMSPTPPLKLETPENREVWLQSSLDPEGAMELLARRAGRVEGRLRRLEDYVTSREYAWEKKMKRT